MFCPKCGIEIKQENALFCPKCGASINESKHNDISFQNSDLEKETPKEKPVSKNAKNEYEKFLQLSDEKREIYLKKLNKKQEKSVNHSKKAIIKKIALKIVVAILIYVIVASSSVCVLACNNIIDVPPFVEAVLEKIGIMENEEDNQTQKTESKDSNNSENKEADDDNKNDDKEDDPLTPENKKKIEEYNNTCNSVSEVIKKYLALIGKATTDEYGYEYIPYEDIYDAINAAAQEMLENGKIADYEINDDNVLFIFPDNKSYIYSFSKIENTNAGGGKATLKVATYEPCRTNNLGPIVGDSIDNNAKIIEQEFSNYKFSGNYDDGEVDFDAIANIGRNQIVSWSSHGGYSRIRGVFLCTGVQPKDIDTIPNKYANDIGDCIIEGSTESYDDSGIIEYYCVTEEFFKKYIPDNSMNNSIIFFGACDGCKDSGLADVLTEEKGALAVLGFSDTVHSDYDRDMQSSFFKRLTQKKTENLHYSLTEAVEYAKSQNGIYDKVSYKGKTVYTELMMYTDNPDYTLDDFANPGSERNIVLALDVSGSMEGEPLSQTKIAAEKFVNTVKDSGRDVGIAIVTFSDDAQLVCNFTKNYDYLLQKINDIETYDLTNIYDALFLSDELFEKVNTDRNSIVLMTDGEPNEGGESYEIISLAEKIKSNPDRHIYTLGFFSSLDDSENAKNLLDSIASEGCHYEVSDAEQIRYFFEDIASEISGATNYINIIIACPVDVKVTYDGETLSSKDATDSQRTSFGTLTFQENGDSDENDTRTKILRLDANNQYNISIKGNGRGEMDYTIQFMDESGNYSDIRKFNDIKISKSTRIEAIAETADESILNIDENGDGDIDYSYIAKANSVAEKRDLRKFNSVLLWCAAFTVFVMLVLDIIELFNRKKRKEVLNLIASDGSNI